MTWPKVRLTLAWIGGALGGGAPRPPTRPGRAAGAWTAGAPPLTCVPAGAAAGAAGATEPGGGAVTDCCAERREGRVESISNIDINTIFASKWGVATLHARLSPGQTDSTIGQSQG